MILTAYVITIIMINCDILQVLSSKFLSLHFMHLFIFLAHKEQQMSGWHSTIGRFEINSPFNMAGQLITTQTEGSLFLPEKSISEGSSIIKIKMNPSIVAFRIGFML